MEKGMDILLVKDASGNDLVCKVDPGHRFVIDKDGFLVPSRRK